MNRLFINIKKYQQVRKRIPGRVGQIMLHYVERNFRNESYQGKSWKPRKRLRSSSNSNSGSSAQSQSKPLLERTGKLKKSFKLREANWRVIRVGSDRQLKGGGGANLAQVHNEGVSETATVRSYTRRGRDGSVRVRSHRKQVKIPQRQFMPIPGKTTGESLSKELWQDIEKYLDTELDQVFK